MFLAFFAGLVAKEGWHWLFSPDPGFSPPVPIKAEDQASPIDDPMPLLAKRALTTALDTQKATEQRIKTAVDHLNQEQIELDRILDPPKSEPQKASIERVSVAFADFLKAKAASEKVATGQKPVVAIPVKAITESRADLEFTYEVIYRARDQDDLTITELKSKAANNDLSAVAELAKTPFGRLSVDIESLRERMSRLQFTVPQLVTAIDNLNRELTSKLLIIERQKDSIASLEAKINALETARVIQKTNQEEMSNKIRELTTNNVSMNSAIEAVLASCSQKGR